MFSIKNKKLVYAIIVVIMVILIIMLLPKQKRISQKETVENNKQFLKNVLVKEIDNKIISKPKLQKNIIYKQNYNNLDTLYTSSIDTVISIYDSSNSFKGILHLSSSYIDKNKPSEDAFISLKIKGALLNENTYVENSSYKNSNTITEKTKDFGIGIFAGGIFTADKKITYGIGIGLYFNLFN